MRFTPQLIEMLRQFRPLRVVAHFNHPRELSPQADEALRSLIDAGIPVSVQTVLLSGINDDPDVLEALFSGLISRGAEPYYLFQGDLAQGTAHLRCPLEKGLEIYAELRRRLSGLEIPRYAVDAPGGGGKVYLPEGIVGREGDSYILEAASGFRAAYPAHGSIAGSRDLK
jgi:lysine 2,3-aminomutase